jgi:asparagine synthase (glutamine-hydrolysing)
VRKVLPGTLVRLRPGGRDPRETRFWSLSEIAARGAANGNGKGLDAEEAVDALYGKLSEAIRLRTHADVPVGAFLSGGVDSSTVVALMQEQSAEPIRTFTIGFGGREGFDESGIASAISERLGTVHTTVRHDPGVLLDVVPDMGRLMDEPIADPSIIPTYLLSRVTREHVVVALSGDGGDEVFGGYNRYFQGDKLIRMNLRLPFPVRRTLGRMANRIPSAALGRLVSASVARQRTMGGQQDWRERWAKVLRITASRDELAMYRSLLSVGCDAPPVRQARAGAAVSALPADAVFRAAGGDLIDRMMLHDQLEYLPDDLLAKVDRASMAVSLEVRVPLLDHEVVEFAWRLPGRVRRGQSTSKWLLREIASRHIPREILDRPKMGFTVPIADWVQGELRPWGDDIISTASPVDDVLDMDAVRGLWRSTAEGGEHLALGAWALLVLKSWSHDWQASPSVAGAASLG